jgi:16S rRNA (adenine1518-N6/adenine1519-N6)-dimethyltransferase
VLGRSAIRDLAARHGIRPSKALGQNFLTDPNMARAIATDAAIGPGDAVLEVGPGLGSLTVALAATGADVVAVEFDRALVPALEEVCAKLPNVDVVQADALRTEWGEILPPGSVTMVSNLPYNIAVPVLLRMLEEAPSVTTYVVVVQRELGDRLAAGVGDPAYGAVSVKIAYFAEAATVRRMPADVFWPSPSVESTVVRLTRRPVPAVAVDQGALFAVIDAGFAERRKRMTNALRRLGLDAEAALELMRSVELPEAARAEEIDVEGFGRVTAGLLETGVLGGDR